MSIKWIEDINLIQKYYSLPENRENPFLTLHFRQSFILSAILLCLPLLEYGYFVVYQSSSLFFLLVSLIILLTTVIIVFPIVILDMTAFPWISRYRASESHRKTLFFANEYERIILRENNCENTPASPELKLNIFAGCRHNQELLKDRRIYITRVIIISTISLVSALFILSPSKGNGILNTLFGIFTGEKEAALSISSFINSIDDFYGRIIGYILLFFGEISFLSFASHLSNLYAMQMANQIISDKYTP